MEVAEVCWGGAGGDTMACGRERTPKRKASHRPQRSRRGMEVVAEIVGGDTMGWGRERTPKRIYRTEVMKI
jgi:hypothetical protein